MTMEAVGVEEIQKEDKSKFRGKSLCCCCCKRETTKSDVDQDERNGVTVTADSKSAEKELPQIIPNDKTFQQGLLIDKNCTEVPVERRKKCRQKCFRCCKKFTTFLFSNIGLCSAVVAYSILGGFIFQKLEAPNEIQKRQFVARRREEFAKELWRYVEDSNRLIFYEENFTRDAERILSAYQKVVLDAKKAGWDGADDNVDIPPQWSYAGSLLYSVTVITTIGYGHIAPKTFNGQLVTIFYAIFGIPLTLLFLANIGRFLGNCFRLLYKHTCRLCTWLFCPPDESYSKRKLSRSKSKQSQESDPLNIKSDSDTEKNTLKVDTLDRKRKTSRKSLSRSRSSTPTRSDINIVIEDYDEPKPKPEIKTEDIRVPIFVSLMVIALYVFGGALMFSMWEDWNYLEGSYYCFITLSTIGFGDYVPGSISNADSADSKQKLIICCVYLMFGLSILVMGFDLMQEEVRAKFKWLGHKIGLLDDKK